MTYPAAFYCDEGNVAPSDTWTRGPATGDYLVERLDDALGDHELHLQILPANVSKRPLPEATITLVWPADGQAEAVVLRDALLAALRTSAFDFRTAASLAEQLDAPRPAVEQVLQALISEGLVRRPLADDNQYLDWYRLTSRGITWQERFRRIRAIAGRDRF